VVATGIAADRWSSHFDTVSVCFSKGLGAPVGSALAGTREHIRQARRHRKLFGGGMRQAGVIAAGALYALEHHIERLAEDHANAKRLADAIRAIDGFSLEPEVVDTNIVIFGIAPQIGTAADVAARLQERGLLMLAISERQIRAVTHLDVNAEDVAAASQILAAVAKTKPGISDGDSKRRRTSYA
jgi:threonine aldolase